MNTEEFLYEAHIEMDVGSLWPSVQDMMKHLNEMMTPFGFNEKMSLRSDCLVVSITSCIPLTENHIVVFKKAIIKTISGAFPGSAPKISSFELQNVEPIGGA